MKEKGISRRDFLKGSALGAVGLAGMGLMGGVNSVLAEEKKEETFDRECDFLVVGYGLAGEAAALEANDIDPNAKVLVIEKMPEDQAGGNSIASGRTILIPNPDKLDVFKQYWQSCSEPNPIPQQYMDAMAQEMADQRGWIAATVDKVDYELKAITGQPVFWGAQLTEFPDIPGGNFSGCSAIVKPKNVRSEIGSVWKGFDKAVRTRENVELCFSTAMKSLIQDHETKGILGVVATDAEGKEIRIKANKGVVLSCGGYENNMQMQRDFHGVERVYTTGTPGNTGDGIRAAMAVNAKIWHMKNQTQSGGFWVGIKVPEFETAFMASSPRGGSWIHIAADNKRFLNETANMSNQHMKYREYGRYVDLPYDRALPIHLVFDEKSRVGGPVGSTTMAWPALRGNYVWSEDNSVEIEKGWIIKADTIEELAEKMGRSASALKATIKKYNEGVASGKDEFGRDEETMQPIDTPPYYAVELNPALVATTGGAERNEKAQVLDWEGNVIPNLYEAGECGSFISNLYQNGMFLAECIATGRAAAQTAFGGKSTVFMEVDGKGGDPIDISKKEDGVYTQRIVGSHGDFKLQVTIEGGKITDMQIVEGRHNMFMTDKQLKAYFDSVMTQQKVEVDTISGATAESQNLTAALRRVFE